MAATATIAFDKAVYVPGDVITATIIVNLPTNTPVETKTFGATVILSTGETIHLNGTFSLDPDGDPITIASMVVDSSGGLMWSAPTIAGNVIKLTAVY